MNEKKNVSLFLFDMFMKEENRRKRRDEWMECFQVVYETNSMALEVEIETNMSIFALIWSSIEHFHLSFFFAFFCFSYRKKREKERERLCKNKTKPRGTNSKKKEKKKWSEQTTTKWRTEIVQYHRQYSCLTYLHMQRKHVCLFS